MEITVKKTFALAACAVLVAGCAERVPARDPHGQALIGRWQVGADGYSGMVEFFAGGQTMFAWPDGRQDFATYRPISQSTMFLYEDGDSLLIDFRIRGDTLYLRQVRTDEEYHAMRVRK